VDYLLDTNIISYFVREGGIEAGLIRINPASRLSTSAITEGELLYGVEKAPPSRRDRLAMVIAEVLADLTIIPIDNSVTAAYATTRHYLASRGRIIPDNDIWIAAVAMANDYTLVSHDTAFTRNPGLNLEDWLA
jgi:tRNA(fMet)-specific endonuclease VapC